MLRVVYILLTTGKENVHSADCSLPVISNLISVLTFCLAVSINRLSNFHFLSFLSIFRFSFPHFYSFSSFFFTEYCNQKSHIFTVINRDLKKEINVNATSCHWCVNKLLLAMLSLASNDCVLICYHNMALPIKRSN